MAIKKITTEVSELLRIPLSEEEDNIGLYAFVADWLGTPTALVLARAVATSTVVVL